MLEVSLERGKVPLQDYIHNSEKNLRYKSGFRIAGHIFREKSTHPNIKF